MSTQLTEGAPYALADGEGQKMRWFTSTLTLKASAPELGVIDCTITPGEEPPLHVHANESEWFWLLDGEVTFHCGDTDMRGSAGAFVHFPLGIPHTFTVESESARFLIVNTPGGFERMFELAPSTPEEAVGAMTAFGMEIVGPHPREARAA